MSNFEISLREKGVEYFKLFCLWIVLTPHTKNIVRINLMHLMCCDFKPLDYIVAAIIMLANICCFVVYMPLVANKVICNM